MVMSSHNDILVGRGCFMSCLGGQDMIISVEFYQSERTMSTTFTVNVYALSDSTSPDKSRVYLRYIEAIKY